MAEKDAHQAGVAPALLEISFTDALLRKIPFADKISKLCSAASLSAFFRKASRSG